MSVETAVPILPALSPGQTPEQAERVRKIAEAQGKLGKTSIEAIQEAGANLWETDEEFQRFQEILREIRRS